jgi:hypothetical protein
MKGSYTNQSIRMAPTVIRENPNDKHTTVLFGEYSKDVSSAPTMIAPATVAAIRFPERATYAAPRKAPPT